MKKLAVFILVIVMVFSVCAGMAEESVTPRLKTYAGNMLKNLEEIYQEEPDGWGDEFIMMVHAYYDMYQTMSETIRAEEQLDLAANPLSGGKSPMINEAKEQEKLGLLLEKAMLERWEKWLNGEIDSSEYLKLLMDMVGAVTRAMDESK